MIRRLEPMPRPTCHGEEEPAALANAPRRPVVGIIAHTHPADPGRLARHAALIVGETGWFHTLTPEQRKAAIRRSF